MKGKRIFYCELAYFLGIVVLAFGTALMEKADFGMSMVVAPAYLIHLKISEYVPYFLFGISEYVFQAALLAMLSLAMHKFKKSYILPFGTVFIRNSCHNFYSISSPLSSFQFLVFLRF